MLRALGRDDRIDLPDFTMPPLLTGDEIASIAGIPPGPRVGMLKRALLEAELEGKVVTREAAENFIREAGL
jgi:poly(A) polymerase